MENMMENIKSENTHMMKEFGTRFNKIEQKLEVGEKKKVRFEEKI